MQKSKIEWTNWTWNPITGCTKGCVYCYARKMAENPFYAKAFPYEFEPHFYVERLTVMKAKPGDKIFVCSMGELFGDRPDWTRKVLDTISLFPDRTYQLLTKRPENLIQFSPFPDNCWVGISAESTNPALQAMAKFNSISAKVKFVSYEPLLENIGSDLEWWPQHYKESGINWIIIGQQTPVKKHKLPLAWVEKIIKVADKANVKVFLKNNLISVFPQDEKTTCYQIPEWALGEKNWLRQEFPI